MLSKAKDTATWAKMLQERATRDDLDFEYNAGSQTFVYTGVPKQFSRQVCDFQRLAGIEHTRLRKRDISEILPDVSSFDMEEFSNLNPKLPQVNRFKRAWNYMTNSKLKKAVVYTVAGMLVVTSLINPFMAVIGYAFMNKERNGPFGINATLAEVSQNLANQTVDGAVVHNNSSNHFLNNFTNSSESADLESKVSNISGVRSEPTDFLNVNERYAIQSTGEIKERNGAVYADSVDGIYKYDGKSGEIVAKYEERINNFDIDPKTGDIYADGIEDGKRVIIKFDENLKVQEKIETSLDIENLVSTKDHVFIRDAQVPANILQLDRNLNEVDQFASEIFYVAGINSDNIYQINASNQDNLNIKVLDRALNEQYQLDIPRDSQKFGYMFRETDERLIITLLQLNDPSQSIVRIFDKTEGKLVPAGEIEGFNLLPLNADSAILQKYFGPTELSQDLVDITNTNQIYVRISDDRLSFKLSLLHESDGDIWSAEKGNITVASYQNPQERLPANGMLIDKIQVNHPGKGTLVDRLKDAVDQSIDPTLEQGNEEIYIKMKQEVKDADENFLSVRDADGKEHDRKPITILPDGSGYVHYILEGANLNIADTWFHGAGAFLTNGLTVQPDLIYVGVSTTNGVTTEFPLDAHVTPFDSNDYSNAISDHVIIYTGCDLIHQTRMKDGARVGEFDGEVLLEHSGSFYYKDNKNGDTLTVIPEFVNQIADSRAISKSNDSVDFRSQVYDKTSKVTWSNSTFDVITGEVIPLQLPLHTTSETPIDNSTIPVDTSESPVDNEGTELPVLEGTVALLTVTGLLSGRKLVKRKEEEPVNVLASTPTLPDIEMRGLPTEQDLVDSVNIPIRKVKTPVISHKIRSPRQDR
jgi:hypothetical protein